MSPVWPSISVAAVTNAQAAVRSKDRWRRPCPELSIACGRNLGLEREFTNELGVYAESRTPRSSARSRALIRIPLTPRAAANATNESRNESANQFANPHRRAAAGGVLRIPFLLWPRRLRPSRRRRAPLRTSSARNARSLRLGDACATGQSVAGKAGALLLAGDAVVPRSRCHRPGCPSARRL